MQQSDGWGGRGRNKKLLPELNSPPGSYTQNKKTTATIIPQFVDVSCSTCLLLIIAIEKCEVTFVILPFCLYAAMLNVLNLGSVMSGAFQLRAGHN